MSVVLVICGVRHISLNVALSCSHCYSSVRLLCTIDRRLKYISDGEILKSRNDLAASKLQGRWNIVSAINLGLASCDNWSAADGRRGRITELTVAAFAFIPPRQRLGSAFVVAVFEVLETSKRPAEPAAVIVRLLVSAAHPCFQPHGAVAAPVWKEIVQDNRLGPCNPVARSRRCLILSTHTLRPTRPQLVVAEKSVTPDGQQQQQQPFDQVGWRFV